MGGSRFMEVGGRHVVSGLSKMLPLPLRWLSPTTVDCVNVKLDVGQKLNPPHGSTTKGYVSATTVDRTTCTWPPITRNTLLGEEEMKESAIVADATFRA